MYTHIRRRIALLCRGQQKKGALEMNDWGTQKEKDEEDEACMNYHY
jgi:hypothetical protein